MVFAPWVLGAVSGCAVNCGTVHNAERPVECSRPDQTVWPIVAEWQPLGCASTASALWSARPCMLLVPSFSEQSDACHSTDILPAGPPILLWLIW
jgi:hypothetical protein